MMSTLNQVRTAEVRDFLNGRTLIAVVASTAALVFIHHTWAMIVVVLLSILASVSEKSRRWALSLACLGNLFLIERFGQPFGITPAHLIPLFLFNAAFIWIVHHTKFARQNYLTILAAVVLVLGATQIIASHIVDYRLALILTAPIMTNIWVYLNYARVPLSDFTFIERIIWLRPFWYRWLLPYGSYVDIKDKVLRRPSVNFPKLERYAAIFLAITLVTFLFENIFFVKPYAFPKVSWLPHPFELPLVSRQGYQTMFDWYPVDATRSAIRQSWIFLAAQTLAAIHFLLYVGMYSAGAIWTAILAGFDIELHVRAFWRARTFSGFYLRMNYHYTYIIRTHLLPVLARFRFPSVEGRMRDAWIIGASVFPISYLSLYFGRTLWMGSQVAPEERLFAALGNFQYPLITALLCAANVLIRAEHADTKSKIGNSIGPMVRQTARIGLYFFIFQVALIFGFQFLRSSLDIKFEYALAILRIFNPAAYLTSF